MAAGLRVQPLRDLRLKKKNANTTSNNTKMKSTIAEPGEETKGAPEIERTSDVEDKRSRSERGGQVQQTLQAADSDQMNNLLRPNKEKPSGSTRPQLRGRHRLCSEAFEF